MLCKIYTQISQTCPLNINLLKYNGLLDAYIQIVFMSRIINTFGKNILRLAVLFSVLYELGRINDNWFVSSIVISLLLDLSPGDSLLKSILTTEAVHEVPHRNLLKTNDTHIQKMNMHVFFNHKNI